MQNLQNIITKARKKFFPKKLPYLENPTQEENFPWKRKLENRVFFQYNNYLWYFDLTEELLTKVNTFSKEAGNLSRFSPEEWLYNPDLCLVLIYYTHLCCEDLTNKVLDSYLDQIINIMEMLNSLGNIAFNVNLIKDGFHIKGQIQDEGVKLRTNVFELNYKDRDVTQAFEAAKCLGVFEEQLSEVFSYILTFDDLQEYKEGIDLELEVSLD